MENSNEADIGAPEVPRAKLTFCLNSLQQFGQHGRRSLRKGKLLR